MHNFQPESIIPSKRLKIYAQLFGMYQGRDQNLQFDRATMWKIGKQLQYFKGSGTISARFSDILTR
jgi:hypothetical protein